jgi:hypothetical protein
MMSQKPTNPNEIKPMSWQPNVPTPYVKYIKRLLPFLLIALVLTLCAGCSKAVSVTPMPLPPANLAAKCPTLQNPPMVMIDPERALWEADIIAKYTDCSVKHRLTVKAWVDAAAVK